MDQLQRKNTTQFRIVSDYNVSGIPTKFIIDPDGHIRFRLVGFYGNTNQEAKKITLVVDMPRS